MNHNFLPVYVGYDSREDIAYKVCEYSIYKHTPAAEVKPLKQSQLRADGIYTRDVDSLGSTEFTFTRFLVPYLNNYRGWALFCDCDFVWDSNVEEIFNKADPRYAVMVVKHDHRPTNTTKMDGKPQTQYPRKNWSSMILYNCEHPSNQMLTPETVNTKPGSWLHRFEWLKDDEIGSLETRFNFLVGYNKESESGKPVAYHYTEGGPWFEQYRDCEYKNVWWKYLLDYADEVGKNVTLSQTPITWVTSLSREYWDYAARLTMPSWSNLPGELVVVWDDKPIELGFGRNYRFWNEVASIEDPWVREGMGGTKADRFWKKSRVQVWAARKFKGLVIWIDADIMMDQPISRSKAFELLHPGDRMWSTLDSGEDWPNLSDCPIDTGIVAFDTRKEEFQKFIREYSMLWYNGDVYRLPQPYDHHAVNFLRKKYPVKSLAPNYKNWLNTPTEFVSRFVMENSLLREYFTHYLGIEKKDFLNKEAKKKKDK